MDGKVVLQFGSVLALAVSPGFSEMWKEAKLPQERLELIRRSIDNGLVAPTVAPKSPDVLAQQSWGNGFVNSCSTAPRTC